jgi:hypothetical protein
MDTIPHRWIGGNENIPAASHRGPRDVIYAFQASAQYLAKKQDPVEGMGLRVEFEVAIRDRLFSNTRFTSEELIKISPYLVKLWDGPEAIRIKVRSSQTFGYQLDPTLPLNDQVIELADQLNHSYSVESGEPPKPFDALVFAKKHPLLFFNEEIATNIRDFKVSEIETILENMEYDRFFYLHLDDLFHSGDPFIEKTLNDARRRR